MYDNMYLEPPNDANKIMIPVLPENCDLGVAYIYICIYTYVYIYICIYNIYIKYEGQVYFRSEVLQFHGPRELVAVQMGRCASMLVELTIKNSDFT